MLEPESWGIPIGTKRKGAAHRKAFLGKNRDLYQREALVFAEAADIA